MKLRIFLTRLSALAAGVVTYHVALILNWLASHMLAHHLARAGAWASWSENWPIVVGWDRFGEWFFYGYPICMGLATTLFFRSGWPREGARLLLYLMLLAVIGPLTFINYLVRDQWLNLWVQSGFNLFAAFCGYASVLKIRKLKAESADAIALQALAILSISSLLVALPLFNTGVFLAVALKIMDHKQVQAISENVPTAIAGLAGVIAVFLSNLDKIRGKPVSD